MAQSGFFVPAGGKIFFNGDSATVFSDVINQGKLGVGKNATINFTGRKWENDNQSMITDESTGGEGTIGIGGLVRFVSNDTVPQILTGGYNAATATGPAFYHLKVESFSGVELQGSNTKVRNELQFVEGVVYVRNNILVVGNGNPGIISGYDSMHYVVTDNGGTEGFLLREGITDANGRVVFPVGSKRNAYTPVGVHSKSLQPDNFYVNVEDGIKNEMFWRDLSKEGVNKTWQVGKQLRPDKDEVEITLQHLNNDEGSTFASRKQYAYVSHYLQQRWDAGSPQSQPSPGRLTTGTVLVKSGVNSRSFNGTVSSNSYFTKFTGKGDTSTKKTILWFNGYRLDANYVKVYWRTNPEVNNKYFVVQRRLSTETNFKNINTVLTLSVNGISLTDLNYEIKDANNYNGVSFYRLMLVDRDNKSTYSNIIAVAPAPGKYKLLLWPNPTPDKFFIGLNGEVHVRTIVIWNAIGQKLRQIDVNGRSIIEVSGLIPGTYMVSFISTINEIIETKKVIVIGY
jgi:hypothetical protein